MSVEKNTKLWIGLVFVVVVIAIASVAKYHDVSAQRDLPGECVTDQDALVDLMEEYMNRNYKLKQLYEEKAKLFLTYHDHNHSERIYNYLHEHLKD